MMLSGSTSPSYHPSLRRSDERVIGCSSDPVASATASPTAGHIAYSSPLGSPLESFTVGERDVQFAERPLPPVLSLPHLLGNPRSVSKTPRTNKSASTSHWDNLHDSNAPSLPTHLYVLGGPLGYTRRDLRNTMNPQQHGRGTRIDRDTCRRGLQVCCASRSSPA